MKKEEKQPVKKIVEIDGEEKEMLICPYCSGYVREYHTPNGLDDYNREAICLSCGCTWTE